MNVRRPFVAVSIAFLFGAACSDTPPPADQGAGSETGSSYLGQAPPGMTPELFAPGVISTDGREFAISFSPDGLECFFTMSLETNTLMVTREIGGEWTEPRVASFSGRYFDFEPLFVPAGNRVYFGSRRPFEGSGDPIDIHQWYMERTATGWSEPKPTESPFRERFVMYLTHAANGNAYFTGDDGIYVSRFVDGVYQDPERLGHNINYLPWAAHPYVAPDESYLLYDAQPVEGNADLFVSFRKEDGGWSRSVSLGDRFNTEEEDLAPFVTYDGRYLFFSRLTETSGDIYWVDATVIQEHREEAGR
jgi:hypothetical protein